MHYNTEQHGGFNGLPNRQKYYDRALRIIPEELNMVPQPLNIPLDDEHGDVEPAVIAAADTPPGTTEAD